MTVIGQMLHIKWVILLLVPWCLCTSLLPYFLPLQPIFSAIKWTHTQEINVTDLIKKYESFSERAYKCPGGVTTIGFGSTKHPDGTPIKMGDTITEEKAEAYLNDYLIRFVRPHVADLKLKPKQQAAVESLIYNIGWTTFSRSKCYAAIKRKDWETAFKEWDWVRSNGKVLNGLIKRRAEEKYLFFSEI